MTEQKGQTRLMALAPASRMSSSFSLAMAREVFSSTAAQATAASFLVRVIHNRRAGERHHFVECMGVLHLVEVLVNLRGLEIVASVMVRDAQSL